MRAESPILERLLWSTGKVPRQLWIYRDTLGMVVAACTLESSLYDVERMRDESRDDTGSETSGALYE